MFASVRRVKASVTRVDGYGVPEVDTIEVGRQEEGDDDGSTWIGWQCR